jgi:signal transduction histidine kinase
MSFQVSARTILQLGAELISSDGIAFYELIKNAFDAQSANVSIQVVVRAPHGVVDTALRRIALRQPGQKGVQLTKADARLLADVKALVADAIDVGAPDAAELIDELGAADSFGTTEQVLRCANYIRVSDTGVGMTLDDLRDVYLTVGTPVRARERRAQSPNGGRRILGEKGIGRLSVMRLGELLRVESTTAGESNWNTLRIDWRAFGESDAALVQDVKVAPTIGASKLNKAEHGTRLTIGALLAPWDAERLRRIVEDEFSKLTDPFTPKLRFPVVAEFNDQRVEPRRLDTILFEHAHATLNVEFAPGDADTTPVARGRLWYRPPQQKQQQREFTENITIAGDHLFVAAGDAHDEVLRSLGPWSLKVFWYNRRYLSRIEGIGELGNVRKLVKQWAGGVMVFRDGFRVLPYGGPDDDWLALDEKAFGSSGYKLNRQQIIGKLDISSYLNPSLVDQTNREGLRENAEKRALVLLLHTIFIGVFKPFIEHIDREIKAASALSLAEISDRMSEQDARLNGALESLLAVLPAELRKHPALAEISAAAAAMRDSAEEAHQLAEVLEQARGDLVHLASLGLTVEILAHELTRAATGALRTLAKAKRTPGGIGPASRELVAVLESQLTTLSKRLRTLDPLSTAGRQRKEVFELVDWVRTVLAYHSDQFERHSISCQFEVRPKSGTLQVRAVKGMVVQVIENLTSNSVYWLDKRRRRGDSFRARIQASLDVDTRQLRFTDNGPGISPDRIETVFLPFTTTKSDGAGRGLGLYISREIAQYNGWSLYLSPDAGPDGMLHTFVLQLPESDT